MSNRRARYFLRMRASPDIRGITRGVAARLARVKGIAAIVLGGSLARGTADEHSDIDLGLYYDARRPFRIAELERAARELDDRQLQGLVTRFGEWGPGVNGGGWLVVGKRHVDLLYRELGAVSRAIAECRAGKPALLYQLGHPIGFHNQIYAGEIDCCQVLWDPRGKVRRLKRMVAPYPDRLRRAIVTKHLFDACFELAIADKSARRGDTTYVSGCLFRAAGHDARRIRAQPPLADQRERGPRGLTKTQDAAREIRGYDSCCARSSRCHAGRA